MEIDFTEEQTFNAVKSVEDEIEMFDAYDEHRQHMFNEEILMECRNDY